MQRPITILAILLVLATGCSVGSTDSITSATTSQEPAPSAVEPESSGDSDSSDDAASSDDDEPLGAEATEPTPATVATEVPAPVEAPAVLPIAQGPAEVIALSVEDGIEPSRPIVSWAPIDGAQRYELLVRTASGELYWVWQGTATTIPIGGAPQLGPNTAGAALAPGMTWYVVAIGEDGLPIAQSELMTQ